MVNIEGTPRPERAPKAEESESVHETVVGITSERELSEARLHTRSMCDLLGIRGYAAQRVVTTVSELVRNILRYVGEGRLRLVLDMDRQRLMVIAEDQGPGIANIDEILAGEYRSRTGLGRGLLGARSLADEFEVETGTQGTRVSATFHY